MKKLRIKDPYAIRYPDDIKRIENALFDAGYYSTPQQCQHIWEMYSETLCAGWLVLPKEDQHVFSCIKSFIDDSDEPAIDEAERIVFLASELAKIRETLNCLVNSLRHGHYPQQ